MNEKNVPAQRYAPLPEPLAAWVIDFEVNKPGWGTLYQTLVVYAHDLDGAQRELDRNKAGFLTEVHPGAELVFTSDLRRKED